MYLGDTELLRTKVLGHISPLTSGRRILTSPNGTPLATIDGTTVQGAPGPPTWTFTLGDAQHSIRYTRNQTNGTDTRPAYRPFGQDITPGAAGAVGERGYLNKPIDPNGDIRLDHRTYQPTLNLLTTPDPLLAPGDPQSLNPYAYARNNPITASDGSGLEPRVPGIDACASAFDACTSDEQRNVAAGYPQGCSTMYCDEGTVDWRTTPEGGVPITAGSGGYGALGLLHGIYSASGQLTGASYTGDQFNETAELFGGNTDRDSYRLTSFIGEWAPTLIGPGLLAKLGQRVSLRVAENLAAKGVDDGIDLYRHVSPGELADIGQHGFRPGPNSLGGKWFAESGEHATEWGRVLNNGEGSVLKVRVHGSFADQLMRLEKLDGIGPARYVEPHQLDMLNRFGWGLQ